MLVAEDNPVNQALLREQLEELGCRVSLAGDGRQALQLFDSGRFDLLLSDVNMPNMTGYELTQALRERGETLPIIGVTANALREEGERCRAVGMNSWLVKPITLHTLHELLSEFARAGVVLPRKRETSARPRSSTTVSHRRCRNACARFSLRPWARTWRPPGKRFAATTRRGCSRTCIAWPAPWR
ncbi:response regulator [Pseudomonas aeruginosa]|nr:response regulator [Pseudomonas aeruginosa]